MDNPFRLVRLLLWFCVGLLFGGVSVLAYAETIPATPEYEYTNSIGYWYLQYAPAGQWPTPEAACAAVAAYGYPEAHAVYYSPTQYPCKNTANTVTYNTAYFNPGSCPTGWTADTTLQKCKRVSGYTCPAGQNWTLTGSNCTRPDCPATGTVISSGWYDLGTNPDTNAGWSQIGLVCNNGCSAMFHGYIPGGSAIIGGVTHYYAEGEYRASQPEYASCTSGNPVPSTTGGLPNSTCGANQDAGYVNNKFVCVDRSSGQPVDTTTAPAPTTSTTQQSPPVTNPDNSITTTTTTTNTDNSTTTITTTVYPDGSKTTTQTNTPAPNTDPTAAFCEENPDSPLCAKSSFGGACGAFTCDGDAIQCAMAREQHNRNCSLYDEANTFSNLVDKDNPGGTQAQVAAATAALNQDGSSDFDMWTTFQQKQQVYMQFSSTCPDSMGFEFKGQQYTFDLSVLCEIGKVLKLLLHLTAYMTIMGLLARTVPV